MTAHDEGATCKAHKYMPPTARSHPLTSPIGMHRILSLASGDRIGLRTYRFGQQVSRAQAEVLRAGRRYVIVSAFNAEWRMRLEATDRHLPGTLVGMDEWGLDLSAAVVRKRIDRPELALLRLESVKPGDKLMLVGFAPVADGIRKQAHVIAVKRDEIVLRCSRGPKLRMHRTGPLAGCLTNDPIWVLDTTGESP